MCFNPLRSFKKGQSRQRSPSAKELLEVIKSEHLSKTIDPCPVPRASAFFKPSPKEPTEPVGALVLAKDERGAIAPDNGGECIDYFRDFSQDFSGRFDKNMECAAEGSTENPDDAPVGELVEEPIGEPVGRLAGEPVSTLAGEPGSEMTGELVNEPGGEPIAELIGDPIGDGIEELPELHRCPTRRDRRAAIVSLDPGTTLDSASPKEVVVLDPTPFQDMYESSIWTETSKNCGSFNRSSVYQRFGLEPPHDCIQDDEHAPEQVYTRDGIVRSCLLIHLLHLVAKLTDGSQSPPSSLSVIAG